MAGFTKTDSIWLNGTFVPWDDAQVHILSHTLHYGSGVFEGIRSYRTDQGPAVFRLDAHFNRFFESAALLELELPYSLAELMDATLELVRRNRLEDAYLRPIALHGPYSLAVWPQGCPVIVAIAGFPMGTYLAGESVRVTVSPIRRFNASALPAYGKTCGQYVNSIRAVQDALRRGFQEAILLNVRGEVAEGSGENLFLVKNGVLVTNDASADILMGITRDAVLQIARDLGIPTEVRGIRPAELLAADELFFSGTAVEITPIGEVDGTAINGGRMGPVTERIRTRFFDIVRGRQPEYQHWLAYTREQVVAR